MTRSIRTPKVIRDRRSALLPVAGFWHAQRDGSIALRGGPYVLSGAFWNTHRFGLLSVEWTYKKDTK